MKIQLRIQIQDHVWFWGCRSMFPEGKIRSAIRRWEFQYPQESRRAKKLLTPQSIVNYLSFYLLIYDL